MSDRPIVVLDVDGVLKAVTLEAPPGMTSTSVSDLGYSPIVWDPSVCGRLAALVTSGQVEAAWCSAWTVAADAILAPVVGLPSGLRTLDSHHLDEGPTWWKLSELRDLQAADPNRLIVWIDDDLASVARHEPAAATWLAGHADTVLAVSPSTGIGLTHDDLDRVAAWLATSTEATCENPSTPDRKE